MENNTPEQKPEYVAIIRTCKQTGPEDWEILTFTKKLTEETTIGEVKAWAKKAGCEYDQITISNLN
jgi:hypothetical protein